MKTKIALITGGFTGEAEVSLKSAAFVAQKLDNQRFDVYQIILSPEGWFYRDAAGRQFEIERKDFSLPLDKEIVRFDLAFIMLHGSPGEDGKLQGYLDIVGLKYTSCDTLTSALTMNKGYTKALLQDDIPELHLASSVLLNIQQRNEGVKLVAEKLSLPYFVKPNGGGSSIGMTKVKALEALQEAIDRAFDTANAGQQVLVEEFVEGREFSVGVYPSDEGLQVLPATEVITSREFFDFEAKYTPGLTQEITPADLTEEQKQRVERLVKAIYLRLNCKGLVRIDFFLQKETDHFYFIEINTIPGQTETSFIPQQIRAAGFSETAFYSGLIEQALKG